MKKLILVLLFMLVLSFNVYAAGNLNMNIVSVSSSVSPGGNIRLDVNLTNIGVNPLDPIKVTTTDPRDSAGNVLDVNNVVLENANSGLGPLGAMGSRVVSLSIQLPQGQPGTYTATLTVDFDGVSTDSKTYSFNLLSPLSVKFNNAELNSLSVNLESGEDENELSLLLTNIGNVPLTNLRALAIFPDLEDNDDDTVDISNPTPISSLLPGQSATIRFLFDVDSGFDESVLDGVIKIESTESRAKEYNLKLNVKPLSCQLNSKSDKIGLNINKPDDNDDFESGDVVNVDLEVENKDNDDMDVKIEALLYNTDKDKKLDSYVISKNINDDDTEVFKFKLNFDDVKDDDVKLYVKAYNDDDDLMCKSDDVNLDVSVPDHKVTINNPTLSPAIVACGDRVVGNALLKNVGDNDENVVLDVFNTQLGLSLNSQSFELKEDEDENTRALDFAFNTPENAKDGSYPVTLRVRYGGQETNSQVTLVLQGCSAATQVQKSTSVQSSTDDNLVFTGSGVYTEKGLFDKFNKSEFGVPTSVWLLVDLLLVVLIIGCLVWLFRTR